MKRVPLPEQYPEIAREWNAKRNGYPADEASIGSKKWAWWRCLRNPQHDWQQPIYKRVKGLGCPKCIIADKSLAKLFPAVAQEWHVTLNDALTADDVAAKGGHLAWWQCSKDPNHVWQARVCNRTSGRKTDCPYCAGKKVDKSNSLAACRPDLALEWHPTKNALKPDEVVCGFARKHGGNVAETTSMSGEQT